MISNFVDVFSLNLGTNVVSVSGKYDSKIKRLSVNYKNMILPVNLQINKIHLQDFNNCKTRYIFYNEKSSRYIIQTLIFPYLNVYPIKIPLKLIDSNFMKLESINDLIKNDSLILY